MTVVPLRKSSRILSADGVDAAIMRYTPQLRVALNTHIVHGSLDETRLRSVVGRIVLNVAKDSALRMGTSYDPKDPELQSAIQSSMRDIGLYVKQTTRTSQAAVRSMLPRSLPASEKARRLADAEGLSRRDAIRLERYRQTLEGQSRRPAQSTIDQSVKRMRNGMLRDRANAMATHEAGRIVSAARDAAVRSAILNGELPPNVYKVWVAQSDGCPVCARMNGRRVRVGDSFKTPAALIEYPPAHPNCRCTFRLETT